MHTALQTARNEASLQTPIRAEELLTAHFNLAVLEDHKAPDKSTDAPKSRYRVATLRIVLQGGDILPERLPLPADVSTAWLTPYRQVMSRMILGTICLILTTIRTHTT